MELLLKRNEVGRNKYDLFAKLELTPEEKVWMGKTEAAKFFVWQPDEHEAGKEFRSSRLKGAGLAIVLGLIATAVTLNMLIFWLVAPIAWLPLSKWLFNRSRQGITLTDLINGRTIRCTSMDELYVKENAIRDNAQKYYQAHSQMKSLGDEQRITFKPE